MLVNNFYKIKEQSTLQLMGKVAISANIVINKTHTIFQGHFPGMPVVPGVCMIQIIKEIFEIHLKAPVFLTSAGNIKFLSVINPEINNELNVEISFVESPDHHEIDAQLYFGDITFFKIKGTFSASL